MKITIITAGSRGDVQPYIALGVGLKNMGYSVCIPAPAIFESLITEHGLEYIETKCVNPVEFAKSVDMGDASKDKNKYISLVKMFAKLKPVVEKMNSELMEACKDSDAIISTLGFLGAYDISEKLKIPCVFSILQPVHRTSTFSSPMTPNLFNFGPYNKLTHTLVEQLVWQPFKSINNKWRKNDLGLKPHGFWGPFRKIYQGDAPLVCGYSPLVVPNPPDWPDLMDVTGYWFLNEAEGWKAPPDLDAFLQAGKPPVYIGFGSMTDKEPERINQIALDALKLSGQRGILSSGWSGLGDKMLPDTVFRVDSIPHSWLFKRMAAVVHHGGAGTTAAGLRSGVPTIITPFIADQPFWGRQVSKLGLGTKPISYHKLTAEKLAGLINTCLTDESMKSRAKEFGQRIRLENGVEKSARIIDRYLSPLKMKK